MNMAYVNGCTIVDYGACVMKVFQGILRKRVWPAPVQWMAVIRIVQLWKVRMPLLIRSGSGICWTIRLEDRKNYGRDRKNCILYHKA